MFETGSACTGALAVAVRGLSTQQTRLSADGAQVQTQPPAQVSQPLLCSADIVRVVVALKWGHDAIQAGLRGKGTALDTFLLCNISNVRCSNLKMDVLGQVSKTRS